MGIGTTSHGAMRLKSLLENPYLNFLLRLVIGIVFIVASIDKIADPNAFAVSINNYKLVSPGFAMFSATVLPWVELLCGLGLVMGVLYRGSALLSLLMLVVFTVAILIALSRGLDISCGCFTQDPTVGKIGWVKIGENLLLVFGSLYLVLSNKVSSFLSIFRKTR